MLRTQQMATRNGQPDENPRYEPLSMKSLADHSSDDERDDTNSRGDVFCRENLLMTKLSDESDLFSGLSNWNTRKKAKITAHFDLSKQQLELLHKHNVVSNGGLLLVDPIRNEKVCLQQNNHSLTENDLIIVQDENREEDELSLVTEVTYDFKKRDLHLTEQTNNAQTVESPYPGCGDILHPKNMQYFTDNVPRIQRPNLGCDKFHRLHLTLPCINTYQETVAALPTALYESVLVCITSTYIATTNEIEMLSSKQSGIRCSWDEPALSHKLGARFKEGSDGRGYVREVLKGSLAESSGIKIGDVFSVPLNRLDHEEASDLVRKLEYIGMRTTYRELFDMFLSKTTAGWPIAIVLRRETEKNFPVKLQKAIRQTAAFLHELVSKSREFDYLQISLGTHEYIRGNIDLFFPRPFIRRNGSVANLWTSIAAVFEGISKRNYQLIIPPCINQTNSESTSLVSPLVWRRQFLKNAINDIAAFLFSAYSRSCIADTSVIVVRNYDGSWSDPIFVECVISDSSMLHLMGCIEYIMLINDPTIILRLFRYEKVDLYSKGKYNASVNNTSESSQSYQNTSFAKHHGSFFVAHDVMFTVVPSQLNKGANIPHRDITDLHGALKRIESPASMVPHPTVPRNLLKFTSDWELNQSCYASYDLEDPVNFVKGTSLRQYLDAVNNEEIPLIEEAREIEVFHQKFLLLLLDGFSVDYIRSSTETTSVIKGTLVMSIIPGEKLETGRLQFVINNTTMILVELDVSLLNRITVGSPLHCEYRARKRIISLETRDRKELTFIARTSKDAQLCFSGFKLVIEKILQANRVFRTQLMAI